VLGGVWGVIDTSPDFGGQNVLKTFEIAIRLNERPTRTGLERVFCRWIYFRLRSKIFFLPPPFPPHGSATGDQAMTVPSARCSGYFLFFFSVESNKLEFGCVHLLSSALYAYRRCAVRARVYMADWLAAFNVLELD